MVLMGKKTVVGSCWVEQHETIDGKGRETDISCSDGGKGEQGPEERQEH